MQTIYRTSKRIKLLQMYAQCRGISCNDESQRHVNHALLDEV